MDNVSIHSELNAGMKSDLPFFKNVLRDVSQIEYEGNQLPTHGDFAKNNLLFDTSGKVSGILDFDDIRIAPRIKDVANSIFYSCYDETNFNILKYQKFLSIYKNNITLNREEERLIVPAILRESCSIFSWYYDSNKKQSQESLTGMKEIREKTKSLLEKI